MRILMTTDTVGGVWTFTKELTTELLQRGCEVFLISFGDAPSHSQERWCENVIHAHTGFFHYQFSTVALEWMQNNEGSYVCGHLVLLKIVEFFLPDIFLSSQFCFGALPITIPKIVIAHSDVLSWAEACRKHPLEPSEWLTKYCFLVAKGLLDATAVVAPTKWMLHALNINFTLPRSTSIIPNGRSLAQIRGKTVRKRQAVVAGRLWDEAKNIAILTKTVSPIPIILAGAVDGRCLASASQMRGVTTLGTKSQDALLTLFCESAIYICTSLYEPFGLAPLEAALCGCAIIANDIPSLHEVWGQNAMYFRDAASLSVLLSKLNDHDDLLSHAQNLSLRRAETFSSERMADSYVNLFHHLLERARRPADAA